MTVTIHIIDPSKPSLVMTSEVFKDKIPGALVSYSLSAKDGLEYLAAKPTGKSPDIVVVDFDLPDADGVSLAREIRKTYHGPVFLTAFSSEVVKNAVAEELFLYNDSCKWIAKPVRSESLDKQIEEFIFNRFRLGKRFDVEYLGLIVGKGAGRGKRAPKFDGKVTNISLGGACLTMPTPVKLKPGEEFILSMAMPVGLIEGAGPLDDLKPIVASHRAQERAQVKASSMQKAQNAKNKMTTKPPLKQASEVPAKPLVKLEEYKIKATVAWTANGGKQAGLSFSKVSDQQKRHIESFLKGLTV